eukprot:COSAG02_NODE_16652_length_1067_cov_0.727273_1_plen_327_part_01
MLPWKKKRIHGVPDYVDWYTAHHFTTSPVGQAPPAPSQEQQQQRQQQQQHAQWLATHALYDWITSAEVGSHHYPTIAAASKALGSERRCYVLLVMCTFAASSGAFAVFTTIAMSFVSYTQFEASTQGILKPVFSLVSLSLYLWLVNLLTNLVMYTSVRKIVQWWRRAIPAPARDNMQSRGNFELAELPDSPPQWYSYRTLGRLVGASFIPTGLCEVMRYLVQRCCCKRATSNVSQRNSFDMFYLADLACSSEADVSLISLHCGRENGTAMEQSLYRISQLLFECCERIEWTFLHTRCFSALLCTLPVLFVHAAGYDEDGDINLADLV